MQHVARRRAVHRGAVASVTGLIALTLACAPRSACARAQNSVSTQLGVVGLGDDGRLWRATRLDVGARVESIWFRESPRDFGIGPYVEARSAAFVHGDYGGGLIALVPIDLTFPLWLGGGAFARRGDGAWAPGGNAFIAWGSRSFNYDSHYAMAFGLVLDARWHRGPAPGVDVVLAATIDLEGLALPFLYMISALRH